MFCIVIDNISVREVVFSRLSRCFMHQDVKSIRSAFCILHTVKPLDTMNCIEGLGYFILQLRYLSVAGTQLI